MIYESKKGNPAAEATRNIHSAYGEERLNKKEIAEVGLPNSEAEISALKMKIDQYVQLSSMMSSLWHHSKKIQQY